MHKHILIATDGSELATLAVRQGLELAKQLGAKVTIMTGTQLWSVIEMVRHAEDARNPIERYEEMASMHANKVLTAAAAIAAEHGVACETMHIKDTKPSDAIVETAEKSGCDLIVMASHSRRGVNKLLLGSETARVLALTTLPVLVYR
ncbi:MAG: universal stress protein [Beijerinckiaceae bacterium]|nr:universal stress protein [Beijerinckiaceae bacterium]